MPVPRVSVIVPTRDRLEPLRRCIDALTRQTLGAALEIVVVQDGGEAPVESVLAKVPDVLHVRRGHGGPGAARNHGAAVAKGTFLCFTDDDCEPEPGWAEAIAHRLEDGADVVVGQTVNADDRDTLAAASQLVVSHLAEWSLAHGAVYGAANNLGCRADVLRDVPFDERFEFAGGDRDWSRRVAASGHRVVYGPGALVLHRQQLTLRAFARQQLAYGRGAHRYRRIHSSPWHLEPPRFYASLVSRGFAGGPRLGALVLAAQAATATGYIREAIARRG